MEPDEAIIEAIRNAIAALGADSLKVDDLRPNDLPKIGWSGNPAHIRSVAAGLDRAAMGFEEHLALRAPNGEPVAKVRIDYTEAPDTGTLSQLVVADRLQGLGLGTILIRRAEERVRARGCSFACVGVEDHNSRARALYERLGYEPFRRKRVSWEYEDQNGTLRLYETEISVLRRRL